MIPARVVVVEDERVVALHLKQQLTRLGYSVPGMATSSETALRQIRELLPDIVLMDIHIDGQIDGIATAKAIPPELQIPVVYLTAYSEEPTLDRARVTKPFGYLLKPFSERELHATLQMVLERRRADAAIRENERRLELLVEARTAELNQEIARRLQAEFERHETQKMETLGQLTGGVAHDFNNSLNVIMLSLAMIQRRSDLSPEKIQSTAEIAMRSARRAAVLTDRLLAFSRRQPLNPRPLSLNDIIRSMSDMLRRSLGESVVIETALANDLWSTAADANQLESAILNLAVNARDAMPKGGHLTLETTNDVVDAAYCAANTGVVAGDYAVLAVSDDGEGMSKELVSKAFEPFFTTKHTGRGVGLGLSQVYGFLKQSGGHAKIYSEEGQGTTVKLYFPRLQDGPQPAGASPLVGAAPMRSTRGETILVVEDDEDVRASTGGNLRELGYKVVDAPDGHTALQLLETDPAIRLMFTDVGLPGLNGRQLADEARRRRPDVRIVFTSGYAHQALVHQGRLDPDVELLGKPFTFEELAAKIRGALDAPPRA